MKYKCPNNRCGKSDEHKVVFTCDCGIRHSEIECNNCGYHFNVWGCSEEKIKETFGSDYLKYL